MDVFKKRKAIFLIVFLSVVMLGVTWYLNLNLKGNNPETGTSGIDIDNGDTKVNWSKFPTTEISLSESLEIRESGTYILSGEVESGSVVVDAGDYDGVVKLVLSGVSIFSEDSPAIYIKSADDVIIETQIGTKNYLSSGKSFRDFGDEDVNGTIYSKGDLSFSGEGYLEVESNYQDAIVSKDDLTIRSGKISISSADDGIRGKDSVYITGGEIDVTSKQDAIKTTNDENSEKGFVYIEGGEISINAGDDGIHAMTNLTISGGEIDILKSYEGLEAGKVTINGGKISVVANDDGINVAGGNDESAFNRPGAQNFSSKVEDVLTVNDGDIYINSTGDGLDSNGVIYINGGKIVVDGPINSANGALDSENGIFFNGGSVVAVGASGMAESFAESSVGFGVSVFFNTSNIKGTEISILDESGNKIISHISTKSFNHLACGSDKFEVGKTYNIYVDGEKYDSFTILNTVTTVGENTNGGMMGPGGQRDFSTPSDDRNGRGQLTPPEN